MGLFDRFPYSNFHELNLTWILEMLKKIDKTMDEFVAINALKYADPIQWDITRQYEKNTIVIDPLSGTAYISVQPVPSGVALTNTDYWTVVFDLGSFVVRASKNFAAKYEDATTLTATFPSSVNDWLIWGDILYKVISPIVAGDQYVVNSNIQHFTMEELVGHLEDLSTTDKSNVVAALNEVALNLLRVKNAITYSNQQDNTNFATAYAADTLFWWKNDLYVTTSATNIGDPIISYPNAGYNCRAYQLHTLYDEVGRLNNLTTDDTSTIVAAINEVVLNLLRVKNATTYSNQQDNVDFAAAYTADTLFWWKNDLYVTTSATNIGDPIISYPNAGYNCRAYQLHTLYDEVGRLSRLATIDKSSIVNAINEIYTTDYRDAHPAWIIVGDSYGETPTLGQDWCTYLRDALTTHGILAYRCHISGGSFGNTSKYLTALQNLSVPDHAAITDILVCGGYNDINVQSNMPAGISDFLAYMASEYPNARLHIGICCLTTQQNMLSVTFNMERNLVNWSRTYNFNVIENAMYMHRRYDYIATDGVHTLEPASARIAMGLLGYCLNRTVDIYNEYASGTFTIDSSTIASGSITDIEMRGVDEVKVQLNLGSLVLQTPAVFNNIHIATVAPAFMRGAYGIAVPITGFANKNGGGTTPWTGTLIINLGELSIQTVQNDIVDSVIFNTVSFTLPFTIA